MDSLALLCNLYGDGPATLRRLREAGLGSLEVLGTAETERLAGLLRTSVRAARRFQSEARLLRERSELAPERVAAQRQEPAPQQPTDPLLRKVLDAWRRMDDEESIEGAGRSSSPQLPREDVQVPVTPALASAGRGVELRAGVLEGLGAEWIATLASLGIVTLDGLVDCDALEVSRTGVLAYTRLLRLQMLARRELDARGEAAKVSQSRPAVAAGSTGVGAGEDRFPGDIDPDGRDLLQPRPPFALPSARSAGKTVASEPTQPKRFSPAERPRAELSSDLREALLETLSLPAPARAPDASATAEETLDSSGPFA